MTLLNSSIVPLQHTVCPMQWAFVSDVARLATSITDRLGLLRQVQALGRSIVLVHCPWALPRGFWHRQLSSLAVRLNRGSTWSGPHIRCRGGRGRWVTVPPVGYGPLGRVGCHLSLICRVPMS